MFKKEVVIPVGHEMFYEHYHFAPAVKDGDRLYCSGVIGVGPDGKVSDDPRRNSHTRLKSCARC